MQGSSLIGQRFGLLTVVSQSETLSTRGPLWDCRCDCGGTAQTSTGELQAGRQSCGCVMREAFQAAQASRRRRPMQAWPGQDDAPDFEPPPAKPVDPEARAAFLFAPEATLWVIYASPKGYPDRFVVRRWTLDDGDPAVDPEPAAIAESLEAARAALPGGRKQVKAATAHDPTVAEVWR